MYVPAELLVTVRTDEVPSLMTFIVTPGTLAPDSSVTFPTMVPNDSWAKANPDAKRTTNNAANVREFPMFSRTFWSAPAQESTAVSDVVYIY